MKIFHFTSLSALLLLATMGQSQTNTVGTISYDPTLAVDGYTLIYPHNQPHARLIDACGEVVHVWTNDSLRRPGNSAYLTPFGDLIWSHRPANFQSDPIWAGGGGAVIEGRTWDNTVQWNYTLNDSTGRLHHDFALTNSGTVLAIAWERIDSLDAIAAGRNPALLEDGELWSERIIELQPNANGGADVVWEWRAWDHLIQDFDSTKTQFGDPALEPHRIDVNFGTPSSAAPDWLHMNSIDYNAELNQILVSVPTFDELWIIDKGAPEAGLIWRWGNPEAYGRGTAADQQLHYQHAAHWLDAPYHLNTPDFGKIAVFNNRNPGATGPYSSAHLIEPEWLVNDTSAAYAMTGNDEASTYAPMDFDWTWTAPTPTDFFSSGLSNFERLPGGNNLILSGRTGEIFEFTASGDTAWQYRVPLQAGAAVSQGTELGINDNLLFRATRYPSQFPAFNGVDLSPTGTWELDPSPVVSCLPCDLDAVLTIESEFATVDITGANGEVSISWTYEGTTLCTGPELSMNACEGSTSELVEGDQVLVLIVDEAGCEFSTTFTWEIVSVGERSEDWRVYPNPTSGELRLSGVTEATESAVYNSLGQCMAQFTLAPQQGGTTIDLTHLPEGAYVLKMGARRTRILIQR